MSTLDIKYSKIELSDDEMNAIKRIVPKTYELTYDYKSDEAKKQTLLSKYMIVKNLNCTEDDIYYNKLKKPYVKARSYFNVSHSKGHIVFTSSKKEIGIDIEQINAKNLNILNYAFTKNEIDFIKNDAGIFKRQEERLTLIWTIKECIFKASGSEKYYEPKDIETCKNKIISSYVLNKNFLENKINFLEIDYYIYSFKWLDYIVSVASTEKYDDINLAHQVLLDNI